MQAITTWPNVNAVRVPLNESCWLGINGAPANLSGESYKTAIKNYVLRLHKYDLIPILELHWVGPGTTLATRQQPMPDADHATAFWADVATTLGVVAGWAITSLPRLHLILRTEIRIHGRHLRVDIGSRVQAGDLLAEIETPELDEQVKSSQAALAQARANLKIAQTTSDSSAEKIPMTKLVPASYCERTLRIKSTFSSSVCGSDSAQGIHGWRWSRLESIASFIRPASRGS